MWINNREKGEAAVEITRQLAIDFMAGNIDKEAWLEEYYPEQMKIYHQAIEQTRQQLLGL